MKNIKFRNFTITKREILVSIVIAALMIMFGFLISTKWSESQQESDIKYNKAIQIDNDTDLFQYGMETNVGNAFVYGELKVVDSVTYPEIGGEYMYVRKVEEQFYLSRIRKCDLILVNLEHTNTSIGTAQELQFAVDNHIPIIGFNNYDSYEWLPEDCDVIFTGINEAIDYISDFYLE